MKDIECLQLRALGKINSNVNGDAWSVRASSHMQLSEMEVEAVSRVADMIERRPKWSHDEAALALMVGMAPYHLARCFHHHHGISLRRYAQEMGGGLREEIANWVLLAI